MAYEDDRDASAPFIPTPEVDAQISRLPVGWDAATEYHRLKKVLPPGERRSRALDAAIHAVLARAEDCMRHASRPRQRHPASFLEMPEGDLDLEQSIDAGLLLDPNNPSLLRVSTQESAQTDLCLILDMSLSMTGEKVALVAVAAAVLALTLPSKHLGLVAFDSDSTRLKPLGEQISPRELVRRVLEVPARGFTNLEAGMREGLSVLRASQELRRAGVLMTDGAYNVGWDPSPLAPLFPRLHVIQLGEGRGEAIDKGLTRRLASAGRGRYYRAERYEDLPRLAHRLVRDLFR